MPYKFTKDNAKEYGRQGARKRWEIWRAEQEAKQRLIDNPPHIQPESNGYLDPIAVDLSLACAETLALARKSRVPLERAQLARALRDLRETWHLVTGKPKPANAKIEQAKPRRDLPRIVSAQVSQQTGT